jgi:hypothetical protein
MTVSKLVICVKFIIHWKRPMISTHCNYLHRRNSITWKCSYAKESYVNPKLMINENKRYQLNNKDFDFSYLNEASVSSIREEWHKKGTQLRCQCFRFSPSCMHLRRSTNPKSIINWRAILEYTLTTMAATKIRPELVVSSDSSNNPSNTPHKAVT